MNDQQADDRAEQLFYEALERAPHERKDFLEQACGDDVECRAQVEEMLRFHEEAGGFLRVDAPVPVELEPEWARPEVEQAGAIIGRYKLLAPIGEGGFGVVWMAKQFEPVRRQVALKIIKLGMDTKNVVARFEQERQALAMMDHPNIAKVFDAGATPEGRPYFVMELVRGTKITEYCDQANLSMKARLELFMAVCHAVQHAHQKGIIHRDLKPSNILVTLHDGVPVPKVIDFGVAKATQQERLTELTLFTHIEQMIGTPLYMAPEQAELSGLDIDTRSDIYALGVLLYELLTGHTPFDPETLVKAGLEEMRRVIREDEPQKPSTRLSTLAVEARTNIAKIRNQSDRKLIEALRGDLDWIVMKALEKDRTRRYETAVDLAHDIRNHLDDEPIMARPPSQWYRMRKVLRRHKVMFTAGTAVVLSIIIGLGVATWMFLEERNARQEAVIAEEKALSESSKSAEVAEFLEDMLKSVGPSVALGRDTILLEEILSNTEGRLVNLNDQPEVEADLRGVLRDIYRALGKETKAEEMAVTAREVLLGTRNANEEGSSGLSEIGAQDPLTTGPFAQEAYLKSWHSGDSDDNVGKRDRFGGSVAMSGDTVVVGAIEAAYVFVRNGMTWTPQATLKVSSADSDDAFGHCVAIFGDTIVVGAYDEDSSATGVNGDQEDNSTKGAGAAYVFVRAGTTWTQQAYLKASNAGKGDMFGISVSVSEDTIVVGASGKAGSPAGVNAGQEDMSEKNAGAAYVFVRNGTTWTQQAYLKASNTDGDDGFGFGVAVSGDTVIIGAPGEHSQATEVNGDQEDNSAKHSGAAYIFVRNGMTWTQQAYLKASNSEGAKFGDVFGDSFGGRVAVSGDTVVVGALQEDSKARGVNGDAADNDAKDSGAAYVFVRDGTTWTQQAYLKASNTESKDAFAYSLALAGDTIVIGAAFEDSSARGVNGNEEDNGAKDSGAAYVYVREGTTWTQQVYLKASNAEVLDWFGISVAVSGDAIVVGASLEQSSATGVNGKQADNSIADGGGAAYVFRRFDPE